MTKVKSFLSLLYLCEYLSTDILSAILHGSIFSEFLRIASCILRLTDFVSSAPQLNARMITNGGNKETILFQLKKAFQKYHETFPKYCKT